MRERLKQLADEYRAGGGEQTEMILLFEAEIERLRAIVDKEEPKPGWKNASGDRYEVRPVGEKWEIWYLESGGRAHMSSNRGMGKLFPSEEKATAALDKWVEHENSWKRCDEPVPPLEPKPRWERRDGSTYIVRPVGDKWEVWRLNTNCDDFRSGDVSGLFSSEGDANTALDKEMGKGPGWTRCEEPEPSEEPKPRWVDDHDNKYTVQQINDRWEIWFYGNGDISLRSFNWAGDSESWPTEQDAIDVLDAWISMDSESSWKRCDEEASEPCSA